MTKNILKSRTFWLNAIGLVVVALEAVEEPDLLKYTAPALLVANAVLRYLTKEGVTLGLGMDP